MTTVAGKLDSRLTGVGASEAAAVLGVDPHRSALTLYHSKTGDTTPDRDGNEHTHWGNIMEPLLVPEYYRAAAPGARVLTVQELEARYGARCRPAIHDDQRTIAHPTLSYIFATPDGLALMPDGKLRGAEVKNKGARQAQFWGESGTDEIPDEVLVQCHVGMICTQADEWGVGAYFGGADFRTYLIKADAEMAAIIENALTEFWLQHVVPRQPPPVVDGTERTHKTLAQLWKQHSQEVMEADIEQAKLLGEYAMTRGLLEGYKDTVSLLEAKLKEQIADGAGLKAPIGQVTWKRNKDSVVTDWEAVAQHMAQHLPPNLGPSIVMNHTATKPGPRVFRWSAAK